MVDSLIKKAIKKYCQGNADCQKYVEGAMKGFKPELKVAYRCTCTRKQKL